MQKKLMRSRTDSHVGGVCGGLAEYFNIDPTVVRLIFVIATLLGGPGLLVYIVLWMVMPQDNGVSQTEKTKNEEML